ncbi:dynamin family protein [Cupriavidus basilensis]|uniref:Dynamin family protein n=1 Tax=Cupriavidus basilensis TaxID=68895 RepID=A0A7M2GWQ2_9BURK|nr:dynamin family protein [Cupriavidus basilensis]QOT76577.1 dynamin family protein [Cupriavidus basilensis]
MHENNIELLGQEAERLLKVKLDLLNKMMAEPGVVAVAQKGEQQYFDQTSTPELIAMLEGERTKLAGLELVLAVVGTMKAGKSTTINAIVGTEVLPNRNRPMTALPTLIRHTPGQAEPVLKFENRAPVQQLLEELREAIGRPENREHAAKLGQDDDMAELLGLIEARGAFGAHFQGPEAIFGLLKGLNDLVRLSRTLGVDFPFASYSNIDELPVIEVEFAHIDKTGNTKGRLTLLDTPGPNEADQPHLRKMLQEQLSRASAVLLVLDYTQLKSNADAELRGEIEQIAELSRGRVFTLVNKFDQTDRNSDSREKVMSYVAGDLMKGQVKPETVFPVSSRWGYLANRARHELARNNRLPDYAQHPWVKDFAEEALGRRWERQIGDMEEVRGGAKTLWEDSGFDLPLERVIRSAHGRAAIMAVQAAVDKLIGMTEKLENFLNTRETALGREANELRKLIKALLDDVARIEEIEKTKKAQAANALEALGRECGAVSKKVKVDAVAVLDAYFKNGKRIEAEAAKAKLGRTGKRSAAHGSDKTEESRKVGFLGILFGDNSKTDADLDFDPSAPLRFDDKDVAKETLDKMQHSIQEVVQKAELSIAQTLGKLITDFEGRFVSEIFEDARKIISDVKGRMGEDGFNVHFHMPGATKLALKVSAKQMVGDMVGAETVSRTGHRRQTGTWGKVCSWFNTTDLGWETYSYDVTRFVIDVEEVKKAVTKEIDKAFSALGKEIDANIKAPIEEGIAQFFDALKLEVEHIRSDLMQSIRDRERSKAEQEALIQQFANLKKVLPPLISDSQELKGDVDRIDSGEELPA